MNVRVIGALVLRQLYLYQRTPMRLVELMFWPLVDLVVWGNVSSAFLQRATAAQVKEECRRILGESGGTGCFQGCSNAILIGTPPANVEVMFSVR